VENYAAKRGEVHRCIGPGTMKRLSTTEIKQHFAKASPEQLRLLLVCRRELLEIIPTCNEYIKWDGLSYQKPEPDGAIKGGICQISIRNNHVQLSFVHGAFLPDPTQRLKGTRKVKRYLTVEKADQMKDKHFVDLIKASERFDPYK
jgi:hypothetical protein